MRLVNDFTIFRRIQRHLQALGYPTEAIHLEFHNHRGRRIDVVVMHKGRAAVAIEARSGELFPHGDDKLLPFDAAVRQAQFAAVEIGAPFYVVTDGTKFLWFETDQSGRPARLADAKRFNELTALIGDRVAREERIGTAQQALREVLENSYAHRWSPEALPMLLYAYLQRERGDTASYDYLASQRDAPPPSFPEIHAFVLKQDLTRPHFYSDALSVLATSGLSELSPQDALQLIDNLLLKFPMWAGWARLPRWTSDLMVHLGRIRQGDRVFDLTSGMGNVSAAVRLSGAADASRLTVFARHSTDALWTVIQQLLCGRELPLVHIGDPLLVSERFDARERPADCILVAPPFGVSIRDSSLPNTQGRVLTSEEAYLRKALSLLSPDGRIVALLPNGSLSNPARTSLREEVLRENGLIAVLDVGTFLPGSGAAASAVVLDRSTSAPDRIFFANAQHRQQGDHFDCREVPMLTHVLEQFDVWARVKPEGLLPQDETGLTALVDPKDGALNAGPYLARQAQLHLPLASFEHVPLGSVAEVAKGGPIRRVEEGVVPFIGPGAIRPLDVALDPADRTDEAEVKRYPKAMAVEGDIVLNGLSTYIGAAALIEEGRHPINRHVFRIRADLKRVLPAYLAIAINSRYVRDALRKDASGSTMKMLTLPMLRDALIPIPPLSIQKDIVQRVNAAKGERDAAEASLRSRERALSALVDDLGSGEAA
jgi:hypothetical protein